MSGLEDLVDMATTTLGGKTDVCPTTDTAPLDTTMIQVMESVEELEDIVDQVGTGTHTPELVNTEDTAVVGDTTGATDKVAV